MEFREWLYLEMTARGLDPAHTATIGLSAHTADKYQSPATRFGGFFSPIIIFMRFRIDMRYAFSYSYHIGSTHGLPATELSAANLPANSDRETTRPLGGSTGLVFFVGRERWIV